MAGTRSFHAPCVISRQYHSIPGSILHILILQIFLRIIIFMQTECYDVWRGATDLALLKWSLKRWRLSFPIAGGDWCKRRRPQPTHLGDVKQMYAYGTSTYGRKLPPTTWNATIRSVLVEILPKQGQWGHASASIVPESKEPIVSGCIHRPKQSQTFP